MYVRTETPTYLFNLHWLRSLPVSQIMPDIRHTIINCLHYMHCLPMCICASVYACVRACGRAYMCGRRLKTFVIQLCGCRIYNIGVCSRNIFCTNSVEDEERNDGSADKPYYMSADLKEILGKKNKSDEHE